MDTPAPLKIQGYVTALPRSADEAQARVAVMQDEREFRIIPKGLGIDLDEHLSTLVEVTGICTESDGIFRLQVRAYRVLEDDAWLDDTP